MNLYIPIALEPTTLGSRRTPALEKYAVSLIRCDRADLPDPERRPGAAEGGYISPFLGFSYGGDVAVVCGGLNIFLTHGFGIRGDIRHIQTFEDLTLGIIESEKLGFWRGSAGLVFRF